jgi:hypothetical protein
MKDNIEVILVVTLFAFVAVRLYKKYIRKDSNMSGSDIKRGNSFPSSSKDDDYEPYSKK